MHLAHPHLRWKAGNNISLLENGVQLFPALCAAFDAATTSIHVEMYIFRLDIAGKQLLYHLMLAAKRGLKVRVVIDGYGSAAEDETIAQALRSVGGQCRIYRPEPKRLTFKSFDFMRLRRLHRKIVVVDESVGFVGGINFEDDYSTADPAVRATDARFDYAVRVTGPIVLELTEAIDLLWLRLNKSRPLHLKHLRTRLRHFKRHMASLNAASDSRSAPPLNTPAVTISACCERIPSVVRVCFSQGYVEITPGSMTTIMKGKIDATLAVSNKAVSKLTSTTIGKRLLVCLGNTE
jgi:cardiolipin synthase